MAYILHQFPKSHFNEKARWALQFKGVQHKRVSYLPGLHTKPIQALSGQEQTPVLQTDDNVVAGSAAIIDHLEKDHPAPALYPTDSQLRDEALSFQSRFDTEVGPAVRTVVFAALLQSGNYLPNLFGEPQPVFKRMMYRTIFPLARAKVAKANDTDTPEKVERARSITANALDEVAERIGPTGYLFGDAFSVADLTAAALFAPITDLSHPDIAKPKPHPAPLTDCIAAYAEHPAILWVGEMYKRHRPLNPVSHP